MYHISCSRNGQLCNEVSSVHVSLFQQCFSFQIVWFDKMVLIRVLIITARNEVGARLCFYTCLLFCSKGGGGIPACIAGVYQHALQQVSGGGVVSQHALQVSRPTPKGKLNGLARGCLQVHTQGGTQAYTGDLQAHTRGYLLQGVLPAPGGTCTGGVWRAPVKATAVGGTHPTGMHSCFTAIFAKTFDKLLKSAWTWL